LRRRARRLLLRAYTTYYELYADDERSPTGRRVVGDEVAYLILHQLGLVDLERHSRQRTYIVRVLDKKLAEVEAEKHVEGVEEVLRRLVEGRGWVAAFIAACTGNLSDYDKPEPQLLERIMGEVQHLLEGARRAGPSLLHLRM
jgi:Zn-dependent membrane protease YugP